MTSPTTEQATTEQATTTTRYSKPYEFASRQVVTCLWCSTRSTVVAVEVGDIATHDDEVHTCDQRTARGMCNLPTDEHGSCGHEREHVEG